MGLFVQKEVEDAVGPLLDEAHELLGLGTVSVLWPVHDPGLVS